jgi:hypothetical protein
MVHTGLELAGERSSKLGARCIETVHSEREGKKNK